MSVSLSEIVQQTINEGKENDANRKKMFEDFENKFKKKKKNKMNNKVLRSISNLHKKKLISKRIVKKSKKPIIVLRRPQGFNNVASMFFNQVRRGV